ncbi:hypothetical protein ARALYDRAFT_915804 [Arabidopsis lyrata subsp. lyrata]|uniref:Uncharacterized protein n=1 Tax=Arabidopsis lyrata subsp. lyrata TaxID=81972 RepID=D7MI55_ARALL|nr:hypothetical protein ARALYDRAFT_915804 [Arabidopsis lyrata subsp. lyrata]
MASRRRLNLDSFEDIFLKCPIKAFIYSYLKNSGEQFIRVDDEVSVYDPNSSTVSSHALPEEFRTRYETNGVCQIFHCNGLILCQIYRSASNRRDRKLSIWNLVLKEF